MHSVLFVCLGNICRSPAAEAIFGSILDNQGHTDFRARSCGLENWHVGKKPDPRMVKALKNRGITANSTAQVFKDAYFDEFDFILVADKTLLQAILEKPKANRDKVFLMSEFSKLFKRQDVPDPYYGNEDQFEEVIDMLQVITSDFLKHLEGRGY